MYVKIALYCTRIVLSHISVVASFMCCIVREKSIYHSSGGFIPIELARTNERKYRLYNEQHWINGNETNDGTEQGTRAHKHDDAMHEPESTTRV